MQAACPALRSQALHVMAVLPQLEMQRKAKEPLTEEQVQRRAETAARTARGAALMEENLDAVKRMSQLATVAQCAAVR